MKSFFLLSGVVLLLPLLSCQKSDSPSKPLTSLEAKGKSVYYSNCIACHNPNPEIDGSIGPAVAGSSLELLNARVLQRTYPPGYKPKRNSDVMPDFPQLKNDIPALHAYLNSFKK